jgi:hypothetical protein
VVSFTPWLLYPRGKRFQYPLDRRLGGAVMVKRKISAPARIQTLVIQPIA